MKGHDHQIYDIKKYMNNGNSDLICDIGSCSASKRHWRADNDNKTESYDPYLKVYCDSMDSLHVYLLHSHQIGMRVIADNKDNDGSNGR